LNKEAKEQIISHLSSKLKRTIFAVLTNYRGLNVEKIAQLRSELRSVSSDYRIVKNTFLKRASQGTEFEQLYKFFVGPTAILLCYGDPIAPSKVLSKFLENYSELTIKAGFLQGKVLSAKEIKELGSLPGRKELLSKIIFLFTLPHIRLLNVLSCPPLKLIQLLRAIEKNKSDK